MGAHHPSVWSAYSLFDRSVPPSGLPRDDLFPPLLLFWGLGIKEKKKWSLRIAAMCFALMIAVRLALRE